jgi:hypothetical protein
MRGAWLGIALVLVGLAMLLDRLDVMQFGWQPVFWGVVAVFGVVRAVSGFEKKKSGSIFWGTTLFLVGMYNILWRIGVVDVVSYWWPPAILLVIGFSTLMVYSCFPARWHLLVPAVLLLAAGSVLIMTEFGYFSRYEVMRAMRVYWPVGLILFGGALVLRRVSHNHR